MKWKIVDCDIKDEDSKMSEENLYGFVSRDRDKRRAVKRSQYDIKQLWSRSHEIIQLDSLGYKGTEIAKMLGVHPLTVSNTLNSTLGKRRKAELRKERDEEYELLRDDILELTKKSLAVYNQILENEAESSKLRKATADTIVLELSGLRVPTKVDTRSVHMSITPEEIEEFKRRGLEAARASGKLTEIDE